MLQVTCRPRAIPRESREDSYRTYGRALFACVLEACPMKATSKRDRKLSIRCSSERREATASRGYGKGRALPRWIVCFVQSASDTLYCSPSGRDQHRCCDRRFKKCIDLRSHSFTANGLHRLGSRLPLHTEPVGANAAIPT